MNAEFLHRDWDACAALPAAVVVPNDCDFGYDWRCDYAAGFGYDCVLLVVHWIGCDYCDCDCVVWAMD